MKYHLLIIALTLASFLAGVCGLSWASLTRVDLTGTLGTALTSTTNPDPNTLGTKNPYPTVFINPMTVSTAWTTQGSKALFPQGKVVSHAQASAIKLHFVPSGGAAVTYTATIWFYNRLSNSWAKPYIAASNSYAGEVVDYIQNPGNDPIYIQLSNISTGTVSIYYDTTTATAL
jgi:hypothetical protein